MLVIQRITYDKELIWLLKNVGSLKKNLKSFFFNLNSRATESQYSLPCNFDLFNNLLLVYAWKGNSKCFHFAFENIESLCNQDFISDIFLRNKVICLSKVLYICGKVNVTKLCTFSFKKINEKKWHYGSYPRTINIFIAITELCADILHTVVSISQKCFLFKSHSCNYEKTS